MKLSRIDYIGLNGGDGEHYEELRSDGASSYDLEVLMSMTAKDFDAIARILKDNVASFEVCANLAAYCKTANPRFDTDLFIGRCGVSKPNRATDDLNSST